MQNVAQGMTSDSRKNQHEDAPIREPRDEKIAEDTNAEKHDVVLEETATSTPISSNSSPTKSETETSELQPRFMTDSSESDEDSASEVRRTLSRSLILIFFFIARVRTLKCSAWTILVIPPTPSPRGGLRPGCRLLFIAR